MKKYQSPRTLRRTALAMVLGACLMQGVAYGQSTTGSIYGSVAAGQGTTIQIQSDSGFSRTITVDSNGRYNIGSLPVGTYSVKLLNGTQIVDSRDNITLRVNAGTEVSFATASTTLDTITVYGLRSAALDTTSVDSRSVVTARELEILPVGRSAEAIAMLAPGAVSGTTYQFQGKNPTGNSLVSFGGSSVTENAYYINGLNTTDPVSNFGGITLPYGAIAQQEVLTGGYGAAYGRSDGGVVSQVGKRGTDKWEVGVSAEWTPPGTRAGNFDIYYPIGSGKDTDGTIYQRRSENESWATRYSAYAGGPLIPEKLYFFGAVEAEKNEGNTITSSASPYNNNWAYTYPKAYAKLDWNINDSNLLELTGISYKNQYSSSLYEYDYDTGKTGDFDSYDTHTKVNALDWVAKYTSYITDNLTLSAMYGRQRIDYSETTPGASDLIYINATTLQNYALTPDGQRVLSPVALSYDDVDKEAGSKNLRLDLNWHLGNHNITAGIDNQDTYDYNDTQSYRGGYIWFYGRDTSGSYLVGEDSNSSNWVAPVPGGNDGYYVRKYIYTTGASVTVKQRAQYVQDDWQVTDNLLLSIGLRNDQFTNYNGDGVPYVKLTKPQWAPRLGFSWDIKGDSSMRLFGNAGRYYIAMPNSVAIRAASGSLFTSEYFTYSSIDANGVPQGLTPIASSTGGPVSANNEYGQAPDPATVASSNLEAEYLDEYILGFASQLGSTDWTYGTKVTYRDLKNAIDDHCDLDTLNAAATSQLGRDIDLSEEGYSCLMFNPGKTNTYKVSNGNGGYDSFSVTNEEMGLPSLKRKYTSIELFLERPFDGKWYAKLDYVWSKLKGNTEGQVNTFTGQDDVGATTDWDTRRLMEYSDGYLANDRRHQLKAYGSYQLTDEWLFGGNLLVASGTPRNCLGYYGPDQTNPDNYGSYNHWCGGEPSPTGTAGRNPWQQILSLNATYRPSWADSKLAFDIMVYNVLNQRRATQTYSLYGRDGDLNAQYGRILSSTTPRYLRFGIRYDF